MNHGKTINDFTKELNKFGEGLSENIYIIKFESITPDLSILCFATTGIDGNTNFFAALWYDYMHTIKYAKSVINKNFAKVIEFIPPLEKQKGRTEIEQKSVIGTNKQDYFLLARTEKPKGNGYWASRIIIKPKDNITEKLQGLTEKDRGLARQTLAGIMNGSLPEDTKPDPSNFLAGWEKKAARLRINPEDITINDTHYVISLFKNYSGGWEGFYNYANR